MRAGVGAESGGRAGGPGPAPSRRCVSGCRRRVAGAGGRPRGRGAARLPPSAPHCPPGRLTGPRTGGRALGQRRRLGRVDTRLGRVVGRRHRGRSSARPLPPGRPSRRVLVVGRASLGPAEQPVVSRPGDQDVATEAEGSRAPPRVRGGYGGQLRPSRGGRMTVQSLDTPRPFTVQFAASLWTAWRPAGAALGARRGCTRTAGVGQRGVPVPGAGSALPRRRLCRFGRSLPPSAALPPPPSPYLAARRCYRPKIRREARPRAACSW